MNSTPTRTVARTVSQNLDPRMISDYYYNCPYSMLGATLL